MEMLEILLLAASIPARAWAEATSKLCADIESSLSVCECMRASHSLLTSCSSIRKVMVAAAAAAVVV
eukprot:931877-Pelagomonas_calceolata.AAC.1